MELKVQKRLAAHVLKCSEKNVWFDDSMLDEIKEAITKADIRSLVNRGVIQLKVKQHHSRGRSRLISIQKRKGRRRGHGSRKGKAGARSPAKLDWMNRIRTQRDFLSVLKEKSLVSKQDYRMLYNKCKGGFFRSRRHLKIFIEEHNLFIKKQ